MRRYHRVLESLSQRPRLSVNNQDKLLKITPTAPACPSHSSLIGLAFITFPSDDVRSALSFFHRLPRQDNDSPHLNHNITRDCQIRINCLDGTARLRRNETGVTLIVMICKARMAMMDNTLRRAS